MTSAVDRLEGQGLVQRLPHPTHRRTTLADLTDAGRALALEASERRNASVFADPGVPPLEVETLHTILRGLRHRPGDF